ncbi:threonine-phosphate decarboxylase CobD [Desulfotruncus alcoholivorax]|uniref:threonine-phosphate decarboxylase CobD n=1 Tax=Desulfotruncus alcoholivorax TaxID=265477 RepID=UPI000410BF04|nr:threonine-phosphate decarboxylase CobD [Desulfotruncus alcoholivorax]
MEYKHGGDVFGYSRKISCPVQEICDFSANINPLGPSPAAVKAIQDNLDLIRHYPDPSCSELRSALSGYLSIPPENIIFGNGASELIYLIAHVLKFNSALVTAPTFIEYGEAINCAGGAVKEILLQEQKDFALPATQIIKALPGNDVIFICNPNNPTGRVENRSIIKSIIENAEDNGVYTVVDEAFIDFTESVKQFSVIPLLNKYPKLLVLYSLTKFFGIPGLRLGALLGPAEIVRKLETGKDPWNVNILAQVAGKAALSDFDYMDETIKLVRQEREFLYRAISRISGLKAYQGNANYLLVKILKGGMTSSQLVALLAQKGVLIRDCSNFSGLNNSFIRVAVKTRRENVILIEALTEAMKGV